VSACNGENQGEIPRCARNDSSGRVRLSIKLGHYFVPARLTLRLLEGSRWAAGAAHRNSFQSSAAAHQVKCHWLKTRTSLEPAKRISLMILDPFESLS
jgi:hypothetical protein